MVSLFHQAVYRIVLVHGWLCSGYLWLVDREYLFCLVINIGSSARHSNTHFSSHWYPLVVSWLSHKRLDFPLTLCVELFQYINKPIYWSIRFMSWVITHFYGFCLVKLLFKSFLLKYLDISYLYGDHITLMATDLGENSDWLINNSAFGK